ncbi:PiggyBac transposable element-derived protein 4 [Eumeta japonica]|uniref:PiggyBac transposable element-derived protein 4 n=1 Tax=Eumeta variegata TaxID=151549 RepID=A0A4C1TZX3_EUMVA|nr:PiggyBac transposable element-derived protein 4 [Eumeta japonica]
MHRWKDTTVDELYRLFTVFIYMGICQFNTLEEYWRKGTDVELVYFRNLMSYDRYILLTKCLHFSDNKQPLPYVKSKQPLAASKQPVTDCEEKNNNEESVDDCDERAEAGRGRVKSRGLKYRRKSKKLLSNPPATSGTAPNPNIMAKALTAKTTQIVLNLLEGLEHKGHCVTMDNFYNSLALVRYLKCRGFDCLGTVRLTRKNLPEDVKEMKKNCEKGSSLIATPAM